MSKKPDLSAAEYAIGVLDSDARANAEARAERDAEFAAEVERWSVLLGGLAEPITEATPPDGLLDRIEAEIDRFETAPDKTVTLRREQGEWTPMAEGVEYKLLRRDETIERQTLLVRIAPGASYQSHYHEEFEECYVVSGDLSFGAHELRAGDYHVALPGSDHPPASSREGCLLLITNAA